MPNTILQTAGCGLVNGPLGNVSTDTIKKKKITQQIPDQIFSCVLLSSLGGKNIYINFLKSRPLLDKYIFNFSWQNPHLILYIRTNIYFLEPSI